MNKKEKQMKNTEYYITLALAKESLKFLENYKEEKIEELNQKKEQIKKIQNLVNHQCVLVQNLIKK